MLYIFDWDGTLCDSTGTIIKAMQEAAAELYLPRLSDAAVCNIIGLGLPEAIKFLYPKESQEVRDALKSGYSQAFISLDQASPSVLYPFVLETLEYLHAQGHILTVATGKSRRGLDRILKSMDMSGFFHGSRCADETASKPHPKMLQELLADFSLPVERSVMVGDTEFDMDMARQISMPRIAVSYGAHNIERLNVFSPVLSMDCFSEIRLWNDSL